MKLNRKIPAYLYRSILILGLVGIVVACSRKKNKWVNRNYHAMTTYYNILFNGNNALHDGIDQLNFSYFDDYWDILPIERMMKTGKETEYGKMINPDKHRRALPQRATPKKKKDSEKSKGQRNLRNSLAAGKPGNAGKMGGKNRQNTNRPNNANATNFPTNTNANGGFNNGRSNFLN